jgi:hypothetical protein
MLIGSHASGDAIENDAEVVNFGHRRSGEMPGRYTGCFGSCKAARDLTCKQGVLLRPGRSSALPNPHVIVAAHRDNAVQADDADALDGSLEAGAAP